MKNFPVLAIAALLSCSVYAADQSDPFYLAITGQVCEQIGKCQRYNGAAGNFQVGLKKDQAGNSGGMTISYEIEGVTITCAGHEKISAFEVA